MKKAVRFGRDAKKGGEKFLRTYARIRGVLIFPVEAANHEFIAAPLWMTVRFLQRHSAAWASVGHEKCLDST